MQLNNVWVEYNDGTGIVLGNGQLVNCYIQRNGEYGIKMENNVYETYVMGSQITSNAWHGIYMTGYTPNRISIVSCSIGLNSYGNTGQYDDIHIGSTSHPSYFRTIAITGNNIGNPNNNIERYGIYIAKGNGITICGNSIDKCYSGTIYYDSNVIKDNVTIYGNSGVNFTRGYVIKQNNKPVIPDNSTAFWYDTDDNYFYHMYNGYGSNWYTNYSKVI